MGGVWAGVTGGYRPGWVDGKCPLLGGGLYPSMDFD